MNWDEKMTLERYVIAGRPGGSVGNLETFWHWDVSSNVGTVTRTEMEEVLSLQPMIPPKLSVLTFFPLCGVLRRSRCVQIFLQTTS